MSFQALLSPNNYDPNHLDGVLALRALLSQKVEIAVYPRQIVTAVAEGQEPLSFVHGVPDQSSLTSVVSTQHKRMRRAQLERESIPIPKGATFSIGKGIAQSIIFARKVGFPVVIKPSKGDFGSNAITHISSISEVRHAIQVMKMPVHLRENIYRSGYTPMELGIPGVENGEEIVSTGYRFLVEKHHSGDLLNFLVHEGEVLSVAKYQGSPLNGTLECADDITGSAHSYLMNAALRTSQAIPHLALTNIFMVVQKSKFRIKKPKYVVVDFSERPFLSFYGHSNAEIGIRLSGYLIRKHLESKDYKFYEVMERQEVQFKICSLPSASTAVEALIEACEIFEVEAEISVADEVGGYVQGVVKGDAFRIASMVDAMTNDVIPGIPAMLVKLREI